MGDELEQYTNEKDLFLEVLEIEDAQERQTFLEKACAGDVSLHKAVSGLLESADLDDALDLDPDSLEELRGEREALTDDIVQEGAFLEQLDNDLGQIGDYELLEELGRGAMGVVFRARQVSLNREVALKLVLAAALASPEDRQRFRIEAEAAARLDHPYVVPVYEIGVHDGHDYFSMALILGGNLEDYLRSHSFTPREAVQMIRKIAAAVQRAHELGIIHRDLKPANILLDEQGDPHIADFGLASWLERESKLTLSGQILGTPQYMPPELAEGDGAPVSTSADLYSLGAILHEMISGSPPFRANSVLATIQQVKEQPAPTLRSKLPSVNRDLDTIVTTCLEKSPAERYPSVRALIADLTAWLDHEPITARRASATERLARWIRRRPLHAGLLATASLLLLTLGVGGPLAAYRQNVLRRDAELAQRETTLALERSRLQAAANRRLAYNADQRFVELTRELHGKSVLADELLLTNWLPREGGDDLRQWEWFFLFGKGHHEERQFRIKGPVHALSFTTFGKRMAASGSNGTEIRDPFLGALIHRLEESDGHLKADWSPDGQRLTTLSGSGLIEVWNPSNGRRLHQLKHPDGFRDFSWTPAGELVTLSESGFGSWTEEDGHKIQQPVLSDHLDLRQLAVSPNGQYLAAFGSKPELLVWETRNLDREPSMFSGASGQFCDLAWLPSSEMIAASTAAGTTRIWDVPGGQRAVRSKPTPSQPIPSIAWDSQGDQLAMLLPQDRELLVFDLLQSKNRVVESFEASPRTVAWNSSAHTIAVGFDDGKVRLLRSGLPPATKVIAKHAGPIRSLAWSPDGSSLYFRDPKGRKLRFDLTTGVARTLQVPREVTPEIDPEEVRAQHPSEQRLATGDQEGAIQLLDTDTGDLVLTLTGHQGAILELVWGPYGRRLASAGEDGTLRLWDATAGILAAGE
ncbi:MAG: WD40 repeat domain-containing serine/threonine protein kinase [Verrucomicrobiales bacterium]